MVDRIRKHARRRSHMLALLAVVGTGVMLITSPASAAGRSARTLYVKTVPISGELPARCLGMETETYPTHLGRLRIFEEGTRYRTFVRRFGQPLSVSDATTGLFEARWDGRKGMVLGFIEPEVDSTAPISDYWTVGRGQLTGRWWRVEGGLKVGMTVSKLRKRYPNATRHGRRWWIHSYCERSVTGRPQPTVTAHTRHGRVARISFNAG